MSRFGLARQGKAGKSGRGTAGTGMAMQGDAGQPGARLGTETEAERGMDRLG